MLENRASVDVVLLLFPQVLAHVDFDGLSHDALWDITRGLEDFNSIVASIRFTNSQENCLPSNFMHNTVPHHMIALRNNSLTGFTAPPAAAVGLLNFESLELDTVIHNSFRNVGDTIKPIPFLKVLNILAKERSRYIAVLTHRVLTSNEDFLHLAHTVRKKDFSWITDPRVSGAVKWQSDKSHLAPSASNTSDYHSASGSSFSASFSSNSLPRLGKVVLPTLNQDVIAIGEFVIREQEFAAKFLQIVCHSTNFVKRTLNGKHFKVTFEASPTKTPTKLKAISGIPLSTPSPFGSPSDSPISSSSKRQGRKGSASERLSRRASASEGEVKKSVCFADSADYSVMVQLTQLYMDALWKCFNGHLLEHLNDVAWGGTDAVRHQLGCLYHCDDIVAMLVVRMLQQLSVNGECKSCV